MKFHYFIKIEFETSFIKSNLMQLNERTGQDGLEIIGARVAVKMVVSDDVESVIGKEPLSDNCRFTFNDLGIDVSGHDPVD